MCVELIENGTFKKNEVMEIISIISKIKNQKAGMMSISISKRELINIGVGFITVFKAAIGTGILFSPRGVVNTGYMGSLLVMLYYWLLNLISVLLLMKCADKVEGNYSSIATFAMGKSGRIILEVCLVSTAVSFGSVYVTFVTNNIQDIISGIHNCSNEYINYGSALITFLQLVVYLPLMCTNRIQKLAPFVLISNIALLLAIILILIQSLSRIFKSYQKTAFNYIPAVTSIEMLPGFIGTAAYLWVCTPVTLSYYVSLSDRKERKTFTWVYILSICMVFVFASMFTFLCAFAYGEDTLPAITLNLSFTPMAICGKLLYCLSVLLSLPLMIYPMKEIFSRYSGSVGSTLNSKREFETKAINEKGQISNLNGNSIPSIEIEICSTANNSDKLGTINNQKNVSKIQSNKSIFKRIIRINHLKADNLFSSVSMFITCIIITITGYIFHDFLGSLINLIGGLFCVPLNILLPALFHLIIFKKEVNFKVIVLDTIVIFSSIFTSILVIWYSTQNWDTSLQSYCVFNSSKESNK